MTRGKFALVDDDDFEKINQFKWFFHDMGYACRKQRILMHRIIMNPPKNMEVDHINGNGLDNQRKNLRIVTHKQNMYNQKVQKNSISKLKGVRHMRDNRKKPWQAYICPDRKFISLGYFDSAKEAATAYEKAAQKFYGEYANY